jgi:hypothetical protein
MCNPPLKFIEVRSTQPVLGTLDIFEGRACEERRSHDKPFRGFPIIHVSVELLDDGFTDLVIWTVSLALHQRKLRTEILVTLG